jgi:cysteine synthase A
MSALVLDPVIADAGVRSRAVARLRELKLALPKFSELADPTRIPKSLKAAAAAAAPDEAQAGNLWRVHWFNDEARTGVQDVPGYLELPQSLTGVKARIVVALGRRFPMIGAHKVLAAYGCLVPRLVTGRFDPTTHRAVWPSTGNYCRGGVAISRILGCRGVAVLPAGMSAERFEWLERWVTERSDIIRTPGTESNVKEIYDKCKELQADKGNVILNQFSEFANYMVHCHVTGRALERVFIDLQKRTPGLRLSAFVSATGSAGTIAAGDHLKAEHGTKIAAVEAIECPTLLCNGYGEHNIQGIGDKHIPLIHNVMNTDIVVGISDASSDALNLMFNDATGREYLIARRGVDAKLVGKLDNLGISGIANVLAAIKIARHFDLDENDVIMTVATDSADLYGSERAGYGKRHYPKGIDAVDAGCIFGQHLAAVADDHLLDLTYAEQKRIFNLGYYTWVEQQGVSVADFDSRRHQTFWQAIQASVPEWDKLIDEFNRETGAAA